MAEHYKTHDQTTGLEFFRSASPQSGMEEMAERRAFDDRTNAALCRIRAGWLRAMVKHNIQPTRAGDIEAMNLAAGQGHQIFARAVENSGSNLSQTNQVGDEAQLNPIFIGLYIDQLETYARLLAERADRLSAN